VKQFALSVAKAQDNASAPPPLQMNQPSDFPRVEILTEVGGHRSPYKAVLISHMLWLIDVFCRSCPNKTCPVCTLLQTRSCCPRGEKALECPYWRPWPWCLPPASSLNTSAHKLVVSSLSPTPKQGLPTIATNWSGPLDFMNQHNAYPIRVEAMVPVDGTWRVEREHTGESLTDLSEQTLNSRGAGPNLQSSICDS